ncbi:MAG TPA: biotin--[acetyl-CoA-carboxylase] ligase [Oligoflexia bacterium]|nr:biotin--[acetyl-CoA-carboxylase] ligase [Oligoflexia bacterium]HMP47747.1 biotin--[acetyl-CoA-carboxylase] ligase [Oligoflexia bacterium]
MMKSAGKELSKSLDIMSLEINNWSDSFNKIISKLSSANKTAVIVYESCSSTMDAGKNLLKSSSHNESFRGESFRGSEGCFTRLLINEFVIQEGKSIIYWSFPDDVSEVSTVWIFSLSQTSGRGRNNRVWKSNSDGGMYFSLVDSRKHHVSRLSGLSLSVGLSVSDVCNSFGLETGLKWPNDVLMKAYPHKKISGILIETLLSGEGMETFAKTIIGVGINLFQESFPAEIPGTSLFIEKVDISKSYPELCFTFASGIHENYNHFLANGFESVRYLWWERSLVKNSFVTTDHPDIYGQAIGISEDGALLLESELVGHGSRQVHKIYAGEIMCNYDFMC